MALRDRERLRPRTQNRVRFDYEDYCLLPETRRVEIVDGTIIDMTPAPSPRHQAVVRNIAHALATFARPRGDRVYWAPIDVIFSRHDVVQPDIVYLLAGRRTRISERGIEGAPDLIVEVLSPSRPAHDRKLKRDLYQAFGVREYWIADPAARAIDVLVLDPAGRFRRALRHRGRRALRSAVLPSFRFTAAEAFVR